MIEVDVYEEDGVFEASAFIPDAPEPYVRNPFAIATSREDAVKKVQSMVDEIQAAIAAERDGQ